MAKKPLTDYENQLYSYGLGRNFFDNKPVTRKQMALATIPDNPKTLTDNIRRLQMYGGLSGANMPVKNKAFSPYVVPKNVQEATKKVADAGGFKPDLTGAKFDKDGKLIGKTPDDFVPFDTDIFDEANAEILKNLKPGEKPPTKSTMGLMGASDEALAQLGVAENEREKRANEFRKQEEKIAEAQGKPEVGGKALEEAASNASKNTPLEKLFEQSMEDYITNARGVGPEKRTKDLAEYKREFAEATGIDISGKVDKSSALMSLGLAMMQNRAGKGFNVGRLFSEFGKAGEAAMPALEKAKTQARNDAIAAGKFALEMRSADQAKSQAAKEKAMERTDYFIVPKSDNYKGLLANLAEGKGKRQSLSKYELDKLMKNPDFSNQFEALPGSVWSSVISEAMKTPEAKEYFDTTPRPMSLITEDDDPMYKIDVFYGLPNKAKRGQVVGASDPQIDSAYRALQKRFKTNQTNKEKFINLQTMSDEGAVNVFSTLLDTVDSAASAFGVNVSEGANPNEKMKAILTELQAKQASNILGEGGKNTSDFERQLVKSIVGDKTLFSNPDLIEFKIAKLYNDVVTGEENKILEGLTNLDQVSGKQISSYFGDGELTDAERKSMNADLKTLGVVK